MTPRKHAELIKAWADGAEIQMFYHLHGEWLDVESPAWHELSDYRIKPVPKADYTESGYIDFHPFRTVGRYCIRADVTFDGETGEAKKVEIVK